jgi:anhydro-N-acetylmuramic acid kinase
MKKYRGIGLMSGSSLDGLDLACCDFWEEEKGKFRFETVVCDTLPIPPEWQARLLQLPQQSAEIFAKTHVYFAHWLGKQLQAFLQTHQLQPDFVASHGHTVFHHPEHNFTTQIGDGETLASYLPCPLVSNFRNKNVAMGGQGAPLVPFGERALFPEYDLFLNLGGIANLSVGPQALDVAPCNQVFNFLARQHEPELAFDPEGQLAAKGTFLPELFEALNQLPFYKTPPPKSLGNQWIYREFLPVILSQEIKPTDALRTSVEHLAFQIARALGKMGGRGKPILVTGGGQKNCFLMERLQEQLTPLQVEIAAVSEELVDYKEAIIFALLGLCTLLGRPNILGSASGLSHDMIGGAIHLPPGGTYRLFPF